MIKLPDARLSAAEHFALNLLVDLSRLVPAAATLDVVRLELSEEAPRELRGWMAVGWGIDVANGVDWIVNKLGKSSAKIGIVYQNDEYGADGLRGYKAALNTYHFNDVGQVPFAATDTDFTSQVAAMKSAGAEYVFLVATPTSAGKIVGTGAAGGYLPNWVFQGPAWSSLLMTSNGTTTGLTGAALAFFVSSFLSSAASREARPRASIPDRMALWLPLIRGTLTKPAAQPIRAPPGNDSFGTD